MQAPTCDIINDGYCYVDLTLSWYCVTPMIPAPLSCGLVGGLDGCTSASVGIA